VETPGRRGKKATLALLAALTLAGLGLRVGYAVEQPYAPPPDAVAYERIAENLSANGSFEARPAGAAREVQPASAYAPGLPLFAAAVYRLLGGPHLTVALVLLALIGAAAIPLTYLLGVRLSGPVAGLVGAAALAVYPALLQYQGLLLTEPLAATLLVAALLAFVVASDRPRSSTPRRSAGEPNIDGPPRPRPAAAWAACGVLLGLLALVRPEYLGIAILLPLLSLSRDALTPADGTKSEARSRFSSRRLGMGALVSLLATVVVVAPWTIHNAVSLGRLVPISTGGGKALYIGTYLGADGDGPKLREALLEDRPVLRARLERGGALDDPHRFVLERVLARVAAERYPGIDVDAALGRLGRSHLEYDVSEEPLRFAGMLAGKAYETWTEPARAVMDAEPWRALQLAVALLALAGLAILAWRRRILAALACGLVLLYMTAIGALLIASPRRELVVLPLLAALAGVAAAGAGDSLARRWAR
jgi:4-amino-4-deoxy-L-arabinose transferase-like glycosyltransferase